MGLVDQLPGSVLPGIHELWLKPSLAQVVTLYCGSSSAIEPLSTGSNDRRCCSSCVQCRPIGSESLVITCLHVVASWKRNIIFWYSSNKFATYKSALGLCRRTKPAHVQ